MSSLQVRLDVDPDRHMFERELPEPDVDTKPSDRLLQAARILDELAQTLRRMAGVARVDEPDKAARLPSPAPTSYRCTVGDCGRFSGSAAAGPMHTLQRHRDAHRRAGHKWDEIVDGTVLQLRSAPALPDAVKAATGGIIPRRPWFLCTVGVCGRSHNGPTGTRWAAGDLGAHLMLMHDEHGDSYTVTDQTNTDDCTVEVHPA